MPIDPTSVTVDELTGDDTDEEEPVSSTSEEEEEEDITDEVPDDPAQKETSNEEDVDETDDPSGEEEPGEEEPDDEDTPEEEEDDQEEEETEEEEAQVSLFEELGAELGMDEAIDGESYDETIDGFVEFTEDAVQTAMQQQWQETFEQFPDVEQYVQFRMQGGDPEEYQEAFFNASWTDTQVSEDDTNQQKDIIRENLSEDFDDEEISDFIDEYEAAGTLETEAKKSLRQLQNQEQANQEQLLEDQEEEAKKQQKQIEEYWDNVQETIQDQDEFHGIPVPKGEEDDFFSFMAEDVTDGEGISRRDQMVQEMDTEDRLAVDLILYYDFDLDKLAELKAKTKNANSLRDRLKSSKGRADVTDQQSNDADDQEIDPERDIPDPSQLLG